MRQDQYEKLQAMSEKLTDVILAEADPDQWPGAGIAPGAMDQQTRGDRYWCKKNAVATISLVDRVNRLTGQIQAASSNGAGAAAVPEGETDEEGLDADVRKAEKEAAKLLDQMTRAAAKKNFDQRVHGKN
jgi:hypothetical protein